MSSPGPVPKGVLPDGVRSRFVDGINGLRMHVLEAGFEDEGRPCLLLLHGFPELAYSWRKIMLPLAAAGFHVVAPDQRGYGRTTGWDADYDGDLAPFGLLNLVTDALCLVSALGHRTVASVIGHDFGSPVAAWCAVARPDVFRSVALLSAPFDGTPALPLGPAPSESGIQDALARLDRPRKHYQWYYSTRPANADMLNAKQGIHAFLRAYFHAKSGNWAENNPFPLTSWTAGELAKMPTYYIMDRDQDMAATVAPEMPSPAEIAACTWLPESELRFFTEEFGRTGFQGGLQWYRCRTDRAAIAGLRLFAGLTIDVPSIFIAGKRDWGVYQMPGSLDRMQTSACTKLQGVYLVEGAGHWVQQERPEAVTALLMAFLTSAAAAVQA